MADAPQTNPPKSPHDMTMAELQAEIGRLRMILHWKVCGDPRESATVTFAAPKMEPNLKAAHVHER